MSPAAREFVDWMRRLGWNQSETARQLLVTPSHINQIVNGKAEPSAAMLQLLRLTAARQTGEAARLPAEPPASETAEAFWRELRRQRLNRMPAARQKQFLAALATVLGLDWPPRGRSARAEQQLKAKEHR